MAQGNPKKSSFKLQKGKAKNSKPLGPKKGRVIHPKKAAKVKAEKHKKVLQKNIGQSIEQELRERAIKDGNELRILHGSQDTSSSKNPQRKDKLKKT